MNSSGMNKGARYTKQEVMHHWDILPDVEAAGAMHLISDLREFQEVYKRCYENAFSGVLLPQIGSISDDCKFVTVILKRVLNDFRCVWNLILCGYSTQGATVAASLFEASLLVTYLAGNPRDVQRVRARSDGGFPWSIQALARKVVSVSRSSDASQGSPTGKAEIQSASSALYAQYKYLCGIKHPSWHSLVHDTRASNVNNSEYAVMACPNVQEEDLRIKRLVLIVSVIRLNEAADNYVIAYRDTESSEYEKFKIEAAKIRGESGRLIKTVPVL